MSVIDDCLLIQHNCYLGLHRWALIGIQMPEGHVKLPGGEICLDCHERKPDPFPTPAVLRFPAASRPVSVRQAGRLRTADATA